MGDYDGITEAFKVKLEETGYDDFISKSFKMKELLGKVEKYIN